MVHWELRKKFDHTNKWYMHDPESVLKNGAHKILWDFETQTDHLISNRRPHLVIFNNNKKKKTCKIVHIALLIDHRVKLKESEKKDKYRDLTRELKKKTVEHKSDGDTNSIWCSWYSHKKD